MTFISKEKIFCKIFGEINFDKHEKEYNRALNWAATQIHKAEEIKGQVTKQAKWEICSDGYYPYCTNCNKEPPSGEMTDYCPNCGYCMRGDKNE